MKYFSIAELTNSSVAKARGIDNSPSETVVNNLTALVENILDPLREAFGAPLVVSSGYRSSELNKAVKGAVSSQHLTGHAADITAGSRSRNMILFRLVVKLNLPFDQLIFEKGDPAVGPDWVHISYDPNRARRQILSL